MLLIAYPYLPFIDFESSRHLKRDEAEEDFELPILDTDNDGMPDGWEITYGLNPYDGTDAKEDLDNDGFDFNNDNKINETEKYTNLEEYSNNTDPTNKDTDKDGMIDGWEINYGLDPLENDASRDIDYDSLENILEFKNPDYLFILKKEYIEYMEKGIVSIELVGAFESKNFTLSKKAKITEKSDNKWKITDGNIIYLIEESKNQLKIFPEKEIDTDGIRTTDPTEQDTDGDGLGDREEYFHFTDPTNLDSDYDEMRDGWEVKNELNPTKDDASEDPDQDGYDFNRDGKINETEKFTNLEEYNAGTHPKRNDTDRDGIYDGWEVFYYFNPFVNDSYKDEDDDGYDFYKDGKIVHEEFNNLEEFHAGTDPTNKDTDRDGLPDGWEVHYELNPFDNSDAYIDSDNDSFDKNRNRKIDDEEDYNNTKEYIYGTNPINKDTDGDGMPDGWEFVYDLHPYNSSGYHGAEGDPDKDGLNNKYEYTNPNIDTDGITWTDPLNNDTDEDGAFDGKEALLKPIGSDPTNKDTDGDEMEDGWEIKYGLNVTKDDADGNPDNDGYDFLSNTIYPYLFRNHNGSLISIYIVRENNSFNFTNIEEWYWTKNNSPKEANPNNPDTDNDIMPDGWEWAYGKSFNPKYILDLSDPSDADKDPDKDGLINKYEYKNPFDFDGNSTTSISIPDTDGDWVNDGEEVFNEKFGYLFNLSFTYKEYLNYDQVSEELRNAFMDNNVNLSVDAKISKVYQTNWEIIDNKSRYGIENTGTELEISYGFITDPTCWDTDNDLMGDGWEAKFAKWDNENKTFMPDPTNKSDAFEDPDYDSYLEKRFYNIDEYNISRYAKYDGYIGTDPNNNDTDGDLMQDGWELSYDLNPFENDSFFDNDYDGFDFNNDWKINETEQFTNLEEYLHGTNPIDEDTDGDYIIDGWEVYFGLNPKIKDAYEDPDNDKLDNIDEFINPKDVNVDEIEWTSPKNPDSDGDGVLDGYEIENGTDPTINDTDNDGMPDGWELKYRDKLDATVDDSDCDPDKDGLINSAEYENPKDYDYDGNIRTNPTIKDSDNDGIEDGEEVIEGSDGFFTDPTMFDTDEDGLPDGWEVNYGFYPSRGNDNSTQDPDDDLLNNIDEYQNNFDVDGITSSDPRVNDTDGDGILDGEEIVGTYGYVTDPSCKDTDGDGLDDGWEIENGFNPREQDADLDPDKDGLSNYEEYLNGSDPNNNDTDNDGILDGEEANWTGGEDGFVTNATNNDTDGDYIPDKWEVDNGLNPTIDDSYEDPDNDFLVNIEEYKNQIDYDGINFTDPWNEDTDGDGIKDGTETKVFFTDPTTNDTDRDGMPDGWETGYGLDPLIDDRNLDYDQDGYDFDSNGTIYGEENFTNLEEYLNGTKPNNKDTDNDLMFDGWEVWYEFNPNDNRDADLDFDNDGFDYDNNGLNQTEKFTNLEEFLNDTNPISSDTDNDSMPDGWEAYYDLDPNRNDTDEDPDNDSYDADYNGTIEVNEKFSNIREYEYGTDPKNPDTDGDGMKDGWEWYFDK